MVLGFCILDSAYTYIYIYQKMAFCILDYALCKNLAVSWPLYAIESIFATCSAWVESIRQNVQDLMIVFWRSVDRTDNRGTRMTLFSTLILGLEGRCERATNAVAAASSSGGNCAWPWNRITINESGNRATATSAGCMRPTSLCHEGDGVSKDMKKAAGFFLEGHGVAKLGINNLLLTSRILKAGA